MKTHGLSGTPEYSTWKHMISRCSNPSDENFENYGGRGIKVCKRWLEFQNFLEDMGARPRSHSIERIDNNGNYEPSNCKWATKSEQNSNTRRPKKSVFISGRFGFIPDFLREFGIKKSTFYSRIKRGWSLEQAINPNMGGNHGPQ